VDFSPQAWLAAWITGLAFLSASLGAQEVIGMAAGGRADLTATAVSAIWRWCS
jgi:hypothetical protein